MDRTKGTLLYASSLTVMSGATIAPSLPLIEETFHDVPHLSILVPLVLTTPSLFIAVGSWIAGLGVDRWGRKPFLTLGAAVYALAGTAGLWLADLHLLLLSRAVLGLAVAAVMTATTTLIGDLYRDEERTRFLGIQAAFMGLGGIVFLLPLCIFIGGVSWSYVSESWAIMEASPEPGGIPAVFLLKTLMPLMALNLLLQGLAETLRSALLLVEEPA